MELRRKAIRLREYDYRTPGAYYVTICLANRDELLGDVIEGDFLPNEIGKIVETTLVTLPDRFQGCLVDSFVTMPNHVHAVIFLGIDSTDEGVATEKGRSRPTPTENRGDANISGNRGFVGAGLDLPSPSNNGASSRIAHPALSDVIRAFKTISAIGANKILGRTGSPFWQRNYYEHIIRNDASLERIREYIANNPANWAIDEENPERR